MILFPKELSASPLAAPTMEMDIATTKVKRKKAILSSRHHKPYGINKKSPTKLGYEVHEVAHSPQVHVRVSTTSWSS